MRSFGGGFGELESKNSRIVVVVVCGQYRLAADFAIVDACRVWSLLVIWMCFVTVECPSDHRCSLVTDVVCWLVRPGL
jgi:hypothetical protein